jgi:hypothetical protein
MFPSTPSSSEFSLHFNFSDQNFVCNSHFSRASWGLSKYLCVTALTRIMLSRHAREHHTPLSSTDYFLTLSQILNYKNSDTTATQSFRSNQEQVSWSKSLNDQYGRRNFIVRHVNCSTTSKN